MVKGFCRFGHFDELSDRLSDCAGAGGKAGSAGEGAGMFRLAATRGWVWA